MIGKPKIDHRKESRYLGIRDRVPFKGMSPHVTKLFKEIRRWADEHNVKATAAPFLRYYVIDMTGEMDLEVGIPVSGEHKGDDRVRAGVLPAGRYASLVYTGSGYAGNKALIEWTRAKGLTWDHWDDPKGDAFASRYETYLTDPKVEPHKKMWKVEVAIKLADV